MSTNWTSEQQSVIFLRDCNLLVSAAAGSGKTAVLVERILSMVTDALHPVDVDRLLVVTFTNAAAGEMKDRIRAAIEKRLEDMRPGTPKEERLYEHLQRQMSLLSNAQITTIHSFCQYVIRNYFHTIGLDPGLRIADEGEQKLLQNDVADALLEEMYREGQEDFLYMAQCYAPGRDDRAVRDMVLSLYHFSTSFPWPGEWLEECKKMYEISDVEELDASSWARELMKNADSILQEAKEEMGEAIQILKSASADGLPHPYLAAYQADAALMERLLKETAYSGRCRAFVEMGSFVRLSAKKDARLSNEDKSRVRELRDHYKDLIKRLGREYFYEEPEKIVRDMQKSAPAARTLLTLTGLFARRFSLEKQKKGLMDFDDLEHYALQILVKKEDGKEVPTQTARELSARYEEVMIDEYQDSNLVQELILNAVSRIFQGAHNRFMVGDVKQSIYRFRLARPKLFMEKYRSYSAAEGTCRRISLHKNFRSRAEVLAGINFLFEQLMQDDLGGVRYDEKAALYPGASFAAGSLGEFRGTEVLILETGARDEEQPEETAREMEARMAAERIRKIVGKELVWDKEQGQYRPAQYKDIVILLRTMQGWAEVFSKMLADLGVPAHTGSGTGYFSTVEVQTVLSLLRVIDNPRQDIPLTAVLCSPIVGLCAKELADIRSAHPEGPFFEACMASERLRGFFTMLGEFRELAVYTPIHELLWQVLDRTGYGQYAAAMPGGSQRKANLSMLVEKAIAYERGSYRGLYHFIRYIENLHKYEVDFGEAAAFGEQEDVVRILSIHKSKGLEFPIVFVCGMGKQMNQSDARTAVIAHADLGVGCDYVDPKMRTRTPTLLKRLMARRTVQENLGEELRVLYVAMTRAKEKLILTGTLKSLSEKLEKIHGVTNRQETALAYSLRAAVLTYWDWILPALLRNKCMDHVCGCASERPIRHPLYSRECFIRVRCISTGNLVQAEEARQENAYLTKEALLSLPLETVYDAPLRRKLEENLTYAYPAAGGEIPGKVSVSELKKLSALREENDGAQLYEEPAPVPLIPEFLKTKKEISGAARGTVYHRLMECLDFTVFVKEGGAGKDLEEEIARLVKEGFLQDEEAALIDREKILFFLTQPIGQRMAAAAARGQLFRERQFVMGVAADLVNASWPASEQVLIQGIIDAYFVEDGGIVLVDYKTDFVKMKEASSLYEKYAVQLDYYEMALERLTHLRVREKMIYSFCLNRVLQGKDRG